MLVVCPDGRHSIRQSGWMAPKALRGYGMACRRAANVRPWGQTSVARHDGEVEAPNASDPGHGRLPSLTCLA
jgi:hypothetical protein